MTYTCNACKYGFGMTPDGHKPSPGTVWCGKRKISMGRDRTMPCFVPLVSERSRRCQDCRWAKMLKPSGEAPMLGRIWCEKRHTEMNKLRTMECLE